MARWGWVFFGMALLVGCSDGSGIPPLVDGSADTGAGDGAADGSGPDGSSPDGSALDGSSPDGSMDGGTPDGGDGSMADGSADGGVGDGAAGDGAVMDGGPVDGGSVDAGPVDAGPVDTGPPCTPLGACDPFDSASCPSGETCRSGFDGGTACDATGTTLGAEGTTCATRRDCAGGLRCVSFGDGFVCHRLCHAGTVGECATGEACTGRVGADDCLRVCRAFAERCDIFSQDCADPGDACTLAIHPETRERYTGCRPAGELTLGEACGSGLGTCIGGLVCVTTAGAATCREVCDPSDGDPGCSAAGEACTGMTTSWAVPFCR